ncbi:MAG: sulfotransferase [Desulfobacterales bacterium]
MTYQDLLNKVMNLLIGEAATHAVIAEDGPITLKRLNKHRRRLRNIKRELRPSAPGWQSLHAACRRHLRPIDCPLVLISEIQRSGGSLLSQLFDGHPELHAHPHELKIGFPRKFNWPPIDLKDTPLRWLEILFESNVISHFKSGYKKQRNLDETFLFLFLASVQKELFLKYIRGIESVSVRNVFDAYMTSYFGAWLNNQNATGDKKYITGFTARLSMDETNMASFFDIYPDGRLISIVRNPKNWYPSALRHKPHVYHDLAESLALWNRNAAAMQANKHRFGDRVCLLTFEDLIGKTEAVMQHLADFLGISYDPIFLTPTFNKFPIKANTSFKAQQHGIIDHTLNRYKTLANEELAQIDAMTQDQYADIVKVCQQF